MRVILFIVSLTINFSGALFGQVYHPMLADSNRWTVVEHFESCRTLTIRAFGDTTVNNVSYKKVYCKIPFGNNQELRSLYREDTLSRKIHSLRVTLGNVVMFPEHVHYDFTLQKGDSIQLWNDYLVRDFHVLGDSLGWFRVDSVGSFNTYIGLRKLIHLSRIHYLGDPMLDRLTWLESVGEIDLSNASTQSSVYYWTGIPTTVQCFFQNGNKVLYNKVSNIPPLDTSCYCNFDIGIDEVAQRKSEFVVVPNPFSRTIQVVFGDEDAKSSVATIYSLKGVKVFSKIVHNRENLDLGFLPNGMYYLTFPLNGKTVSKRIVKE